MCICVLAIFTIFFCSFVSFMRYARFFANVSPGLALWVCQVMTYVIGAAFLSRDLVGWLSTWVEETARLGAQYVVGVPQQDGQKDGNLFDGYYSSNSAAAAVVTRFDCNLVSFNFRCGERPFLRGWVEILDRHVWHVSVMGGKFLWFGCEIEMRWMVSFMGNFAFQDFTAGNSIYNEICTRIFGCLDIFSSETPSLY